VDLCNIVCCRVLHIARGVDCRLPYTIFVCVRGTIPPLAPFYSLQPERADFDRGGKRSVPARPTGQTRVGEGLEALPHSQTQRATRSRGRLSRFYKNPDGHNEINKKGTFYIVHILVFLSPFSCLHLSSSSSCCFSSFVFCFSLPCAVLCVSPFCVQTHTINNHTHSIRHTHTNTSCRLSPSLSPSKKAKLTYCTSTIQKDGPTPPSPPTSLLLPNTDTDPGARDRSRRSLTPAAPPPR